MQPALAAMQDVNFNMGLSEMNFRKILDRCGRQ
jgi:hypothetical protein